MLKITQLINNFKQNKKNIKNCQSEKQTIEITKNWSNVNKQALIWQVEEQDVFCNLYRKIYKDDNNKICNCEKLK